MSNPPPDTDTVGPCTIRWSPTSTPETRAGLLAKMRHIPKHRARPAVNHDRARSLADRHGAAILEGTTDAPPASARCMVRVYYRSMGGEILAFDAGPMTPNAADRMQRQCTEALDTDRFALGESKSLMRGARLVVLPSQRAEPVQVETADLAFEITPTPALIVEPIAEPAPTPIAEPTPVALPPVYPVLAPVARGSFYGAAMARRAARGVA